MKQYKTTIFSLIFFTVFLNSLQASDCSKKLDQLVRIDLPIGKQMSIARDAFKNHEYKKAIEYLNIILRFNPRNPYALTLYGKSQFRLGNYDIALLAQKMAVDSFGFNPKSANEIAKTLSALNRYDEALEYLDRALEINAEDKFLLTTKTYVLIQTQNYELATKNINLALELYPDDVFNIAQKALVLELTDQTEEAIKVNFQLLALKPKDFKAKLNIIKYYFKLGQYNEVLEHINKFITKHPEKLELRIFKGTALYRLERYEDSYYFALDLLKNDYLATDIYRLMFKNLIAMEKFEQAISSLNLIKKNNLALYEQLTTFKMIAYFRLRQYQKLIDFAGEIDDKKSIHYQFMAKSYFRLDNNIKALEFTDKAISTQQENHFSNKARRAQILIILERYDEALEELNELLITNQDNEVVKGLKSLALLKKDKPKQSLAMAQTLTEPFYRNLYSALSLIQLNQYDQALKQLLNIDHLQDFKVTWHIAQIYFYQKKYQQSYSELIKVLESIKNPSSHLLAAVLKLEQVDSSIKRAPIVDQIINQLNPIELTKILQAKDDLSFAGWDFPIFDYQRDISISHNVME